jgi:hypothetical protein
MKQVSNDTSVSAHRGCPLTLSPSENAQDMFAVVHVGGTQYKVSVDDTIVTQKLEADIGSEVCSEH